MIKSNLGRGLVVNPNSNENRALLRRTMPKTLNRPLSWRTSGMIGALGKIPGALPIGLAAGFGYGMEYATADRFNFERGTMKTAGYALGGAVMAGLTKLGPIGWGINAALMAPIFLPEGGLKSALETAGSYLMGEKAGDYFVKMHEKVARSVRGDFGGQKITMNERLMRSQNEALSMLRQSRGVTMMGREAQLMHN